MCAVVRYQASTLGGNLDHVSDKLQSSRKQKVTAARSRMGGWGLKGERQPSKGY